MLSILVTYYNQQQYVSRSLDSILAQNLTEPFEVLVGDDGSQDDTVKIVEKYQERFPDIIKLFVMPRDLSVKYSAVERASANRLNLLQNCKGDYVCFLDGDDNYCNNEFMQQSIDALKKDKKAVGVVHNYIEVFDDGTVKRHDNISKKNYITSAQYTKNLYVHVGAIVFKQLVDLATIDKLKKLKSFDDNDITQLYLNYGDLIYRNVDVYNYYQNDGSIWSSANDFEKNLINAIDYEILKQIIIKNHMQLFYKYFYCVNYVYRNKKELVKTEYSKYHNQCVKEELIDKLFNWHTLSLSKKAVLICNYFFKQVLFFVLRVLNKIFKLVRGV